MLRYFVPEFDFLQLQLLQRLTLGLLGLRMPFGHPRHVGLDDDDDDGDDGDGDDGYDDDE